MKNDRVMRVLRPSLALTALAIVLVVLGLAIVGPAQAASPAPTPSDAPVVLLRAAEVRFGEDVVVPAGTTAPQVVTFGGDITVDGTVTDEVVAFGGDIVINGTVGTSIVAFGGDVTLGPKAVAGRDLNPSEASLVLFGGNLTQDPGAQVVGQTNSFDGVGWGKALGWAAGLLVVNPFWGLSIVGWIAQTAFFLVLALVAAALMPRQLRSLQRHLGWKPWASLGWGSLIFFIIGPAVMIVLIISIIGLLLVLPYGLFVLLAYFFVTTGVAAYLAQRVISGFGGKENLMLAVTLGVVGTTVLSRIPVAGPLLLAVMMVFGTGAAALGIAEYRRVRRQQVADQAAASAMQGAAPYPAPVQAAAVTAAAVWPAVEAAAATPANPAATSVMESGTAVTEAGTVVTQPSPAEPETAAQVDVEQAVTVAAQAPATDETSVAEAATVAGTSETGVAEADETPVGSAAAPGCADEATAEPPAEPAGASGPEAPAQDLEAAGPAEV